VSRPPPNASLPPLVSAAALAACVLAAFHNTFSVPFHLDDEISLLENDTLKHLWPLGPVLFPPTNVFFAGRPLLNLSFALNHAISGMSLAGFHAVNLAIHFAAGLLGRMGRYREAVAEFERVLRLDPANAEALRSLPQLRALVAQEAASPPRP
jgi:tetratricopeptide (TPR) repeat protein